MKYSVLVFFACLALVCSGLRLQAAPIQVKSCAVLPFQAVGDTGPQGQDLDRLTRRYTQRLAQTAAFMVLPLDATRQLLRAATGQDRAAAYLSTAVSIGNGIGVSHVIVGHVEQDTDAIHLVTTLIDCRRGEGIRSARSTWRGTFERFLDLGSASNLKTLLRDVHPASSSHPGVQTDTGANTVLGRRPPPTRTRRPVPSRPPASRDEIKNDDDPPVRAFRTWPFALSGAGPRRSRPKREIAPLSWQPALAVLEDRLEVGVRFTSVNLDQPHGSFLGTINRLEEDTSAGPLIFANWVIFPYAGVELAWDRVEAITHTYSRPESDGNVVMDGPVLLAYARYPWDVRLADRTMHVVPYAGIGRAFFSAEFNELPWWGLGFSSPAEHDQWRSAGSPDRPNSGYTRSIQLTDDDGFVFALGCSVRAWDGVSVELTYRSTDVNTQATFTRAYTNGNNETVSGRFPMSYSWLGIGVRYSF